MEVDKDEKARLQMLSCVKTILNLGKIQQTKKGFIECQR